VPVDDAHGIRAHAPLRLHRRRPRGERDAPLVPGAVDPLAVLHGRRAADGAVVDDRPAGLASLAERTALVRAVVRDRVERPLDAVDADAVPAHRQDPLRPFGELVDRTDDELLLLPDRGAHQTRVWPSIAGTSLGRLKSLIPFSNMIASRSCSGIWRITHFGSSNVQCG